MFNESFGLHPSSGQLKMLQDQIELLTLKAKEADEAKTEMEHYKASLHTLFLAGVIDAEGQIQKW